jgi:hypothetical protein
MVTWSALIPGIREIRGPLVAGYLWMLIVWLALGEQLPDSASDPIFERLWQVGDILGRLGLAAVASVVAYLLGSMIHSVTSALLTRARGRGLLWVHEPYGIPDGYEVGKSDRWIPVETLMKSETHGAKKYFSLPFFDVDVAGPLLRLEQMELSEVREKVNNAARHALDVTEGNAHYKLLSLRGRVPVVGIPRSDVDLAELTIPQFSPFEDIWENRSLLETRLREEVPATASTIERLDAEAEFREAIALPLVILVLVVTLGVSWLWVVSLVVPAALFVQALSLRRAAGHELVDSLRARGGTQNLERITPVFANYRADAERLADALIKANWNNMRYRDERLDHELAEADRKSE